MPVTVKTTSPASQKSTGKGVSQLERTTTQAAGSSADGSTGEATSQLVTKVVVPGTTPAPKTGPAAPTK